VEPIKMREFDIGVQWWRTETKWPRDFHNADYQVLADRNPNGAFLDDWWFGFLKLLNGWKALRPYSGADVTELLKANRHELSAAWRHVCSPVRDKDITGVTWEQVRAFPDVVGRLKPTRSPSPVFMSKFCHFLLPTIFPVVDNKAVNGSGNYEAYFNLIKGTWETTAVDVRRGLIAQLTRLIEEDGRGTVCAGFPFATKITELALIGRKHAQRH
jgi:hypothetical protein